MPKPRSLIPAHDRRRRELAAIHLGAKELGLDDETYRDMLEQVTGKRSAAKMDAKARAKVIEHLKHSGALIRRGPRRMGGTLARTVREIKDGGAKSQEAMILGLWDELIRLGAFRHGRFARLDTFMDRMGVPVSHPRFCTPEQAVKVIEALKAWVVRQRKKRDRA